MVLLLDNFDSFTFNLVHYFEQIGVSCMVLRNDVPLSDFTHLPFQGVVLSPGPATPAQAGNLMQVIDHYYQKLPLLGICLGHQAIGAFFGARLQKARKPMHGKISQITTQTSDLLFEALPSSMPVVRYHSLILEDLPPALCATAHTAEGEIMALRHQQLPIWGVQFHPEAILTTHGLAILQNWTKCLHAPSN